MSELFARLACNFWNGIPVFTMSDNVDNLRFVLGVGAFWVVEDSSGTIRDQTPILPGF